jgi:hypothetical protein
VLNHFCYSAQPFLLHRPVIFSTVLSHFCEPGHPSLLQCPSIPSAMLILVAMLGYFSKLNHFLLSYSAQLFFIEQSNSFTK